MWFDGQINHACLIDSIVVMTKHIFMGIRHYGFVSNAQHFAILKKNKINHDVSTCIFSFNAINIKPGFSSLSHCISVCVSYMTILSSDLETDKEIEPSFLFN